MFSVHLIDGGTQSTRLPATPRLKMWSNSTRGTWPSQRILATDCPTVPNPSRPTRTVSTVRDITLRSRTRLLQGASAVPRRRHHYRYGPPQRPPHPSGDQILPARRPPRLSPFRLHRSPAPSFLLK